MYGEGMAVLADSMHANVTSSTLWSAHTISACQWV